MRKGFIFLLLLCTAQVDAQSESNIEASRQMMLKAKEKPLYVVMESEDAKFVAKLEKKGKTAELDTYRKLINNNNVYLKTAAQKYLTQFPNPTYISSVEFKNMSEKERKKFNVLYRSLPMKLGMAQNAKYNSVTGSSSRGWAWSESDLESLKMDSTNTEDNSIIEFITEYDGEMFPLFAQHMSKLFYPYGEACYAIRRMNTTMTDMLEKRDANFALSKIEEIISGLGTKTLIVCKENLAKDVTEAEIKKAYPHNFKLVDRVEYENELQGSNDKILVLLALPIPAGPYVNVGLTHTIFDPSTGYAHCPNAKKCKGAVEAKHFEYYTKTK